MKRLDHVRQVLTEFHCSHPELPSLTVETVWNQAWKSEETRKINRTTGWKKTTGIYFFVDSCAATDIHGVASDDRFTVIRRIGKADYSFADRIADYGHTVGGEPGQRTTWYKADNLWHRWFRYGQIDIIRCDKAFAFQLETFFLARIRTDCNDKDVPVALKQCAPLIYDSES